MNLNHDAIALLDAVLDADTGETLPVAYLRAGYLPEDVGGDVLYRPEHLRLQRARVRQALGVDVGDSGVDASEPISAAEWLATASSLPDEEDWRALAPRPEETRAPEEPVRGAEAAAVILKVDRSSVDRRIRSLPPELRPTPVGIGKRKRWWWANRSAVIEWWVGTAPKPMATGARRPRSPASAAASDGAVDVRAAVKQLARKG